MADNNAVTETALSEEVELSYPLQVQYCGECTMPLEFCEYSGKAECCKAWLMANLPDMYQQMYVSPSGENADAKGEGGEVDEKKKTKRGGKGSKLAKVSVAEVAADRKITLQRSTRGRNKSTTVVKGLKTFGIELKVASKFFAQKFACGSSVTGDDEIVIQGDVKDELFDLILEKWKQVDEKLIEDLGDLKR